MPVITLRIDMPAIDRSLSDCRSVGRAAGGTRESSGAEWYVENIKEELDSPREWFADFSNGKI